MELVPVFRLLRRRWRRIAAGTVVGILVAMAIGTSHTPSLGYAKVQVIIDTPRSALVDAAPGGIDTLYWRASVLGLTLGTNRARGQMARAIGVPVDQLAVTNNNLAEPSIPAALPVAATQAATNATDSSLAVTTDGILPVVGVEATAPTPARAGRLALAAVHLLQAGSSPQSTAAAQRLNIRPAGPIQTRVVPGATSGKRTAEAVIGVLFLWCLLASLGSAMLRRVRRIRPAGPALS